MIFATSLPRFKAFLGNSLCKNSDWACCLLFITPFLLPLCRRSVAAAARSLLHDVRDAGWLLRWLGSSTAPAALLAAAQRQLLHVARDRADRLHLVAIDSTMHGQQGQHTQNTYACRNTQKRPRKSDRSQKKFHRRSEHCFVFAVLLTPQGLRIPYWLPFYTQQHCALFGRQHYTQADLAGQVLDGITLPPGTPVVVVGDTAFEAKQVRPACARRGWQWVVPLNPERRLAGQPGQRVPVRALSGPLQATDFRQVSFRLDQGDLAAMARVSPQRSQSRKHQRTYWVHHRTASIHHVGEVALLFSTKIDPRTPGGVKVQKVLISNALAATTEELLTWFALRWQIEQFFKEMKSDLGMCQYKLGMFARVVNWVNLSVVSFCYLEWYRWHKHQEARGKEKPFWQRLRTAGLKEKVRQQAQRADLEALLVLAAAEDGPERLRALLDAIGGQPAAMAG
jgi:Transposase DDE domain